MASAHVPRHAIAAARYAATAVWYVAAGVDADAAAIQEREWQLHHLEDLVKGRDPDNP